MNFTNQSRNNINKDIVKKAAEHLILTNGQTTTLEVKKHLRNQDYLAFQNEVSTILEDIADDQNWYSEFNGTYRTFAFQKPTNFATSWGVPAFSDN